MIRLATTAACLALTVSLFAQQQSTADPSLEMEALSKHRAELAKQWLQSNDPLHIAWGAAIARQENLKEVEPLLRQQLDNYQAGTSTDGSYVEPADRDRHDAMLAVLDTAITFHTVVPVKTLSKLYSEFPSAALILLLGVGDDAKYEVLLNIFRNSKFTDAWLVAGNVISGDLCPHAGFAETLLSRFTKHLEVTVVDSRSGIGGGIGTGSCGDSFSQPKSGWPAITVYGLHHGPNSEGDTLLAGGPEPVYYQRYYSKLYYIPGGCSSSDDRDIFRSQYLFRLLKTRDAAKQIDVHPNAYIQWKDPATFRRDLLSAIVEQRAGIFRAIQELTQNNQLTEEEATHLQPRLEVKVTDIRHDKSIALPVVLHNDPTTKLVSQFTPPLE